MTLTESEYPEFTSSGLVRELAISMYTGVPTHPDWAETLACCMVGMVMGNTRYLYNTFGKLMGNIFVIYIGASGLSFKTVPLKKVVRPMLKKLTDAVNEVICGINGTSLQEFKNEWDESSHAPSHEKRTKEWKIRRALLEALKRRLVDFVAPQRFTSEFLITWLKDNPQGMIVGDEYSKMFKGASKKDYLVDNMEDLSRLYDGDMEKVGTQTRGVEYPEGAYIAFCSATTYYLLTLMTDDFFIQGTGNRILWILDVVREKVDIEKEALSGTFFWGIKEEQEFENRMNFLVSKLMNIMSLPEEVIPLSLEAGIALDRYRLEKYNEAVELFSDDLLNKDANLVARLAQNAMKLALVHCIGRYAWDYDPSDPVESMEITERDALWAIEKMEKHLVHYHQIREVSARVRLTTTRSYTSDQDRVMYVIDRLTKTGVEPTKTKIMQQTGWLKDDCQAVLDSMVAIGIIGQKTSIATQKKTTYYYIIDKS